GLASLSRMPASTSVLLTAHIRRWAREGGGAEICYGLLYSLVAAGALVLIPRPVLRGVACRLPGTPERERLHEQRQHQAGTRAREQLERVAAVFEELGQIFSEQHGTAAAPADEHPSERFVARVYDSVCRDCSQRSLCWERFLYQTYRDLMATAAQAGPEGHLRPKELADGLRQRCIKPPQLLKAVVGVLDAMRVEAYWRTRLEESRELVPRQLTGIASIITGVADQMNRIPPHLDTAAEDRKSVV